jgi:5-formyltetrahydrofolate cyclo-ligase
MGAEVHTHDLIREMLEKGCRVGVPWCHGDELELTRIMSFDELRPRTLGIPEPRREIREDPARIIAPGQVEISLIPGLAFTIGGVRLGWGRGYYDRMLARATKTLRIGLAFDCQIFPALPASPTDVPMHLVITESAIWTAHDSGTESLSV